MRRALVSLGSATLLSLALAATALGADCWNESKPDGAGVRGTVIIDASTEEVSFDGANPAGRLPGGFADVWLDFDGDGIGDLQVGDDVFLVANHSHKDNPAQGSPAELPMRPADPGGEGRGVGFQHTDE